MKISSSSEPLRPDRVTPAGDGKKSVVASSSEKVVETERVQLSDLAARLNQLETQFAQSDFDTKKVEEVRAAISEGRFKVNAEAVADKLLASVSELLNKKG